MDTRPPNSRHDPDHGRHGSIGGTEEVARRIREISAENDRLFHRLIEGEKHFRRLARAVWKIEEEERRRLALELHDGIGQTLTALKNFLKRQGDNCADDAVRALLDEAFGLAATALRDTRELSRLLRPPVLDDLGLQAGLEWLARIHRERADLDTAIEWEVDDAFEFDAEIETLVFRAVQEALNNVSKHAETNSARVSVNMVVPFLKVAIIDHGKGFDMESVLARDHPADAFGLRGLRDRVELFGGHADIRSAEGKGTAIRFTLPIPAAGESTQEHGKGVDK